MSYVIKKMCLDAGVRGIKSAAIAEVVGISQTSVARHLTLLWKDGEIGRSHMSGNACLWGSPEIWAHFAAARDREAGRREKRRIEREARHPASDRGKPPSSIWAYAAGMA